MKRLLLDTHVLLWWLSDDSQLSSDAREAISDPRNEIYVSAATTWEIAIKTQLGKLQAPVDMESIIEAEGFTPLPITLFHGQQAGHLPPLHRDPFDRMLIAQASAEGLVLVTNDEQIVRYGIRVMGS
jgi:PIN domain nuclease of toxin-antitoxin system